MNIIEDVCLVITDVKVVKAEASSETNQRRFLPRCKIGCGWLCWIRDDGHKHKNGNKDICEIMKIMLCISFIKT